VDNLLSNTVEDGSIDEPAVGRVNMEIPPPDDDEVEFDNFDAANAEVSVAPMVARNPLRPVPAPIPRKGDMAISPEADDTVRAARLVILRMTRDGVESVCARVLVMTVEVRIAPVVVPPPPSMEGG
jgi:hypothetical protein